MIELGEQLTPHDATEAFLDALIAQGEDCIDGPVWRVTGDTTNAEWESFRATACCGYEMGHAIVGGRSLELAATFGH